MKMKNDFIDTMIHMDGYYAQMRPDISYNTICMVLLYMKMKGIQPVLDELEKYVTLYPEISEIIDDKIWREFVKWLDVEHNRQEMRKKMRGDDEDSK